MPFSVSGGTFTLSDTIANATSADATELQAILDDIQTAFNLTFLRDGSATATGQFLQVVSATAGYSFSGDANTGVGSDTGDEVWLMGGGVKTLKANATGVIITGTLAPTGLATFSTLAVTSTSTFSDTITSSGSSVGFVGYEAISTEAAAAAGPILSLYRNSASPAVSDYMGAVNYYGKDSGGNKTLYGQVTCLIADATDGSEDGDVFVLAMVNGALTAVLNNHGTQIQIPGTLAVTGAITGSNIKAPTKQYLTSGTAATYTTPSSPNPKTLIIRMIGAGGGGGGATANNGGAGGDTSFNSIVAKGGSGGSGNSNNGGAGGTGGSGSASLRLDGGEGGGTSGNIGGPGGAGAFGGTGRAGINVAGGAGKTNTGSGGGGGGTGSQSGGGGGAGEYVELIITSPSATYTYTIGAAGTAGAAGGVAGGAGGSGLIIVEEHY